MNEESDLIDYAEVLAAAAAHLARTASASRVDERAAFVPCGQSVVATIYPTPALEPGGR